MFSSQGYAHCVDVYIKQCQEVRIKNGFSHKIYLAAVVGRADFEGKAVIFVIASLGSLPEE